MCAEWWSLQHQKCLSLHQIDGCHLNYTLNGNDTRVGLFRTVRLKLQGLLMWCLKTKKSQILLSMTKSALTGTVCGRSVSEQEKWREVKRPATMAEFVPWLTTHRKGEKNECVLCAAMQNTQDHNPRTMWNVSSNSQWLKPTLVEQLQYTVSGRVLSLWIKIKCRA